MPSHDITHSPLGWRHPLPSVIFQEGEWLCAHCLEYDFATQAKNMDDLRYDLERMIAGDIAISLKNGLKPFQNARRAPEKYWELFSTPEIRTAPLAA